MRWCMRMHRWLGTAGAALALCCAVMPAWGLELHEYQLKAGFVYNFAVLTTWPTDVGDTIKLCIYGRDPFGSDIDALNRKVVGTRVLAVERKTDLESLKTCQLVFIPEGESLRIPRIQDALRGVPALTVAESKDAARLGVMLNLSVVHDRISFEVNQGSARRAGLLFSAKLLRLATEVLP